MTWWGEEAHERTTSGNKARQRWANLSKDAREVVQLDGECQGMLAVRWPMSGWQVWRRLDKEWCEMVADAVDRQDAIALAMQHVLDKLRAP